nr:MAG TPA: hypothetical protein [Caudoviricetes sp.]
MKKSVHLTADSVGYIEARTGEGEMNFSASINAAFEQLAYLARAELPDITDVDFSLLCNVYAGSDLSRIALPLNLARDLLDHYGATIPQQLPEDVRDLVTTLARMSQAQQFALIDAVRVFWCQDA